MESAYRRERGRDVRLDLERRIYEVMKIYVQGLGLFALVMTELLLGNSEKGKEEEKSILEAFFEKEIWIIG